MIARALAQIAESQKLVPWMTCAALLIFATFFAGVLLWTSRRELKPLYRAMGALPLGDEETEVEE